MVRKERRSRRVASELNENDVDKVDREIEALLGTKQVGYEVVARVPLGGSEQFSLDLHAINARAGIFVVPSGALLIDDFATTLGWPVSQLLVPCQPGRQDEPDGVQSFVTLYVCVCVVSASPDTVATRESWRTRLRATIPMQRRRSRLSRMQRRV